jgi:hypothetical protein
VWNRLIERTDTRMAMFDRLPYAPIPYAPR